MKTITLLDGRIVSYPTDENDTYIFYLCGTNPAACELNATLLSLGCDARVDFSTLGWFVRVRK